MLKFRKAKISDANAIHKIVNMFAKKDDMLPLALNEIYEHIRDFTVSVEGRKVVAVCALHLAWGDLGEIRSIAVLKRYQRRGIGEALIKNCLQEAELLGIKKVFALTYNPGYFKKFGFQEIDKNDLPHKVWGDCLKCPKFPDCDEVAVLKQLSP